MEPVATLFPRAADKTVGQSRFLSLARRAPFFLLLFALAAGALQVGVVLGRPRPTLPVEQLEVVVVNVGQGEASWARTPSGRFLVIGGGPPEGGARVVASLKAAGARQIDLLVLPYSYAEVVGGVADLVAAFPIKGALEPPYPPPGQPLVNQNQATVRDLLQAARVPVRQVWASETFALGGGARVEILAPGRPLAAPDAPNNSLVVRLVWKQTAFLWAGGLERAGEVDLLGRAPNLSADWLRVARFGSREACSPEFLRLVRPSLAVISVGQPNAHGFPHEETLARLAAAGARVVRTDAGGNPAGVFRFRSDGARVVADEP